MTTTDLYYCPALRMKGGELLGLHDLASDVADHVLPRLIVPPPAERDLSLQPALFSPETYPDIGAMLAGYWRRQALVDVTYLLDEFGRDRLASWLPRMFVSARQAGAQPTLLMTAKDFLSSDAAAIRQSIDFVSPLKFGLAVSSGQLPDPELMVQLLSALNAVGLHPEDCLVISDFHDSDFSSAELVAPIIGGILQTLQTVGRWHKIVFQGTNFPDHNPADPDGYSLIPRNEWIAWRQAVAFDRDTALQMVFGDYAADCAKMNFGASGGKAIRHYRYTLPNAWLVQRGADGGSHMTTMRKVCVEIVNSGKFAGAEFSNADQHIFDMSSGHGPCGAAREWRATNTTHHITQVVVDIAEIRGTPLQRRRMETPPTQMSLLDVE